MPFKINVHVVYEALRSTAQSFTSLIRPIPLQEKISETTTVGSNPYTWLLPTVLAQSTAFEHGVSVLHVLDLGFSAWHLQLKPKI